MDSRSAARIDLIIAVLLAPTAVLNRVLDSSWWLPAGAALAVALAVVCSRHRTRSALLVVFAITMWSPGTALAAAVIGFRAGRLGVRFTLPMAAVGVLTVGAGLALSRVEPSVAVDSIVFAPLPIALAWACGHYWRQAGLAADRERRRLVDQARIGERERIAQDMHDSLGHEIGLIAVRAGALQVSPRLDEHSVRTAAAELRAGAAAAADRLREVIGVLNPHADGTVHPAATESVAGLVGRARESGLPVTLSQRGPAERAPDMVERAVRRVVQEALTNSAKHAPGAPVAVRVDHLAAATDVTVTSGPATAGARPKATGSGVGLLGLAERVRLAGGVFSAGPVGADFEVSVHLPHNAPTGYPDVDAAADDPVMPTAPVPHPVEEMRRLRLDLARTSVALVAGTTALAALVAYVGW